MRKYLKFTKTMILTLALSVALMSCQKEENQGGLTLRFQAETATSITTKSTLTEGLLLESFKINISEIELEFDDNDPLFATDLVASDYELDGPFEIDLLEEGNTLAATIASNVELPAAAYDEIEFEFEASENSISDMYGKSFLVKGTINGTPFIFWTDEDMEVEIEFEHDFLLEEAEMAMVTVTFDILSLFDTTIGGINIMNAADGNANGIIEIYPGDPDGNEDLADMIAERLEDIIEAQEEQWEEEDDEEDDDEDDDED